MYCCRYRYDPLDRLISHTESTAPRHRFYCKTRLATEIQGALRHSIVQHGDLLLAQQQHENDASGTTLLATDLQRSVLHTLEKNTGRQPIAYSPYGHRSAESGLTSLLGFNGERPDPVTGHYLLGNGYRAFNPVLMRFNSPDSWSPFGKGGLNPYSYCLGDPINKTDDNGHAANSIFQIVAAKKISRNFRINKILPNRELPIPPDFSLTPRELLKISDEYLQVKSDLLATRQHQDKIFNLDLKNRKTLNLMNISAGYVNKYNLPLDSLPPTLQNYAKTPNLPLNSSDLLETLAANPRPGRAYDINALLGRVVGPHPSGRTIAPSIISSYDARMNYIVQEVRDDAMKRHNGILNRLNGTFYHG